MAKLNAAKLAAIMEKSPVKQIICRISSKKIELEDLGLSVKLGYNKDISYEDFIDIIHPQNSDWLRTLSTRWKKRKNDYQTVIQLKNSNSEWIYFEVTEILFSKSASQKSIVIFFHATNITSDASLILEKLQKSESTYRLLFENNPNPMWIYDLNTLEFLEVNNAAIYSYGYSREEFLSMTIKDIRPKEDISALLENVLAVTEGIDDAGIWRHRIKSGEIIYVKITSHTMDYFGRSSELILALNVTETIKAQNTLIESEKRIKKLNRLLTVLSNINQAIVRIRDIDKLLTESCDIAVKDGKFILALFAELDNYGGISVNYYSDYTDDKRPISESLLNSIKLIISNKEEYFGSNSYFLCNDVSTYDFCLSLSNEKFIKEIKSFSIFEIKNEKYFQYLVLFSSDKNFFDYEEIKLLDELSQDLEFALQYNNNERKRKKVEETLLKAKTRAEKSDKLKTEFLAQMSHEIRTPLNVVLSYSNYLKDELHSLDLDQFDGIFEGIGRAARRLIRTIDLILNMSEIQTGSYSLKRKEISLEEEVTSVVKYELAQSAKEKGLKLEVDIRADNTTVETDEYSLSQVILNIADNAIKYTEKGSISISLYRNNLNKLVLEIADSGIGMSEEYLKNLFTPFLQEEQGYSRRFEGTGLGLALSKKYCEMNNISLQVESKKMMGTKFKLIFE